MWEYITGAIVSPLETFRNAAQNKNWPQGLLLMVLVGLIKGAAGVITARSNPAPLGDLSPAEFPFLKTMLDLLQSPTFMLVNSLLSNLLFWFLAGIVCFGLSRLFKGKGSPGGLLAGFGFASAPNLIGGPLSALLSLLGSPGMFLSSVIGFGTGLWVFVLEVISVRESTRIGTGAAAVSLLIAFLAYFFALIILGMLLSLGTLLHTPGTAF